MENGDALKAAPNLRESAGESSSLLCDNGVSPRPGAGDEHPLRTSSTEKLDFGTVERDKMGEEDCAEESKILMVPLKVSPKDPAPRASGEVDFDRPQGDGQQKDFVTYDELLTSVGGFGRHQKRVFLLLALLNVSGGIQTLMTVFTLAVPDHRCALPGMPNDTWQIQSEHHAFLLNLTLPPGTSSPYDTCHIYLHPRPHAASDVTLLSANHSHPHDSVHNHSVEVVHDLAENGGAEEEEERKEEEDEEKKEEKEKGRQVTCDRYVYDTSTYSSSITTQLDLVCSRSLGRSHALMMMMVGSLVILYPLGFFSDLFGRKPVLMLGIVLHLVVAFTISWTSSFAMLMALMFFMGASVSAILCTGFVMCMELVGPAQRKWTGYGVMAFWSMGMMLLAVMAYGLRDWHHLQLASCPIILPFLSYYWFVPESARWLLSRRRRPEAEAILQKIAQVNGVSLPPDMLSRVKVEDKAGVSLLKACFSPTLVVRHLIIFCAWLVNSLTYYGLNWNVSALYGNVYVNFLLMAVVELISIGSCLLLLDRVGRRPLNCGSMLVAGITCTATIFPILYASASAQWITVLLAMIGKLGISGSFATIWIFSSELFPTMLRNSGMGLSSLCARAGGIIAPYIANLGQALQGDAATAVPLVIYGLASIVAGMLLLLLPETLHTSLPETVEDSINMKRKKNSRRFKTDV